MITPTLVSLTLYKNIPFDNNYEKHPLASPNFTFNGNAVSGNIDMFLDMTYEDGGDILTMFSHYVKTGEYNFNHGNLLNTSLVMELSPEEVDCNYMKGVDALGNKYYYFITKITQRNGIAFDLDVELDVLSTYGVKFLDAMKDIPVYTERKHAHRFIDTSGTTSRFRCLDVMNGEPITRGLEPKLIGGVINPKLDLKSTDHNTDFFKDCLWFCLGKTSSSGTYMKCGDLIMPTQSWIGCANKKLIFAVDKVEGETTTHYEFKVDGQYLMKRYENATNTISIKYNPYPPFTDISGWNITEYDYETEKELYIELPSNNVDITKSNDFWGIVIKNSNNEVQLCLGMIELASLFNCFIIEPTSVNIDDGEFLVPFRTKLKHDFKSIELFNGVAVPTITSLKTKENEPKLQCSPYIKYELKTIYEYDGVDIFPEYFISKGLYGGLTITTYNSNYSGDLTLYTTFTTTLRLNQYREIPYYYNKENGFGIYGNPSYTQPVGDSPWNNWNSTQKGSWLLSKVGGVGGSFFGLLSSGMSLATGNKGAIGGYLSNALSLPLNIASTIIERNEIKAKPTTYNNMGTSIVADYSKSINDTSNTANGFLPFIVKKVVNDTMMESALDYYYEYGYNTQRNCYFNTELKFTNGLNAMDNNIFGRCTFNYVKINENITNKIKDENIPLICKQKLNNIFNAGITLWTMFGCGMWFDHPWSSKDEFYQRYLGEKYENIDYNGETYDL